MSDSDFSLRMKLGLVVLLIIISLILGMTYIGLSSNGSAEEFNKAALQEEIHNKINTYRTNQNLAPLIYSNGLEEVGQYHSKNMAEEDFFSHVSPDGEATRDRVDKFNYNCSSSEIGEKIVKTYYNREFTKTGEPKKYTTIEGIANGITREIVESEYGEELDRESWSEQGIGIYKDDKEIYVTHMMC
jgi:hypothetical protein